VNIAKFGFGMVQSIRLKWTLNQWLLNLLQEVCVLLYGMASLVVDPVRETVINALPYVQRENLDEIVEKLKDHGLTDEEDFQFLREEDLLNTLPPVQARRLIGFVKSKKNLGK
jgi:hypothetical protein